MLLLGFLSGKLGSTITLDEKLQRRLGVWLISRRESQEARDGLTIYTPARRGPERFVADLAASMTAKVVLVGRDGDEDRPQIALPNQSLLVLPGYKAYEEFLNETCSELGLYEYGKFLVPTFRHHALYTILDGK